MDFTRNIVANIRKRFLKDDSFTIISNNCFGGFVYKKFNLQYKSPFVGLYILGPDYITLLENFNIQLLKDISFISSKDSKYREYLIRNNRYDKYPIGILDNDIEIHFLHYMTEEEAREKWLTRIERINNEKILFKFSDNDLSNLELMKRFDKLPFKNKVCFTSKPYLDIKSSYYIRQCKDKANVIDEWSYLSTRKILKILNDL